MTEPRYPRAPFPWFGGKSRVAHLVWERFGDVPNYVEPFAGSLAVLLGRPHAPRIETVRAIEHGNNPKLRIALCGYEGEHDMPTSWSMLAWRSQGGYGAQARSRGRENRDRERLWFSPHCLPATQPGIFDEIDAGRRKEAR